MSLLNTYRNQDSILILCLGLNITTEVVEEVQEISGVMTMGSSFLSDNVQREGERVVPDLNGIQPQDAADAYIFLKNHFVNPANTGEM